MATDVATFRIRFPEFADSGEYSDARIQLFLDDAILDIGSDENRWCNKYDLAHAYYGAHLLTVGTKTEAGDTSAALGAIKSKTAGGVSIARGSVDKARSDADDLLASTSYGLRFLSIRNSCFVGILAANCL